MTDQLAILTDIYGDLIAGRRTEVVDAIVADGWPRAMVEEGLDLHAKTWTPIDVVRAYHAELAAERLADPPPGVPDEVLHIWPKLPGAGVTPLLFGLAMGVPRQRVRASRDAANFAAIFCDIAETYAPGRVVQDDRQELEAPVVVVSGSDETLAAVALELAQFDSRPRLIGYGHRVSFAVVHGDVDVARNVAEDVVMWHQYGCFSARAVVVVGTASQADRFAEDLAEAISTVETRLGADVLKVESMLAERAQALGVAEFRGPIHRAKVGWVERRDGIPDGEWIAPHVVPVHQVESAEDVRFGVGPNHMQGIAVAGPADFVRQLVELGERLGATRICRVGELQAPPASWPHDGRPNIVGWLEER